MGNGQSQSESCAEKIHTQVAEIGDNFPFGNEEILRISRCLAYIRHFSTRDYNVDVRKSGSLSVGTSFLSDWNVFCSTLPETNFDDPDFCFKNILQLDEKILSSEGISLAKDSGVEIVQRKRVALMSVIEGKILPKGFGRRFEEVAFLFPGDKVSRDLFLSESCDQKNFGQQSNGSGTVEDQEAAMKRLEYFFDGAAECSRRGARKSLSVIYKCCCDKSGGRIIEKAPAKDLIELAYRLSLACAYLIAVSSKETRNKDLLMDVSPYLPQNDIDNLMVKSLMTFSSKQNNGTGNISPSQKYANDIKVEEEVMLDNDFVSLETFIQWSETVFPCLGSCMETFMHYILFPDRPYPPSRHMFRLPDLGGQTSAFLNHSTNLTTISKEVVDEDKGDYDDVNYRSSPLLFTFACMSPSLGGLWHRIYTSDHDGLAFNRLQNALLGYGGPTLLIIRESKCGGMFGAFSATRWKESKDFYGTSECFLFRLKPSLAVYKSKFSSENYMYCNSAARSKGYDGLAHGIGFGGTSDQPRLFISECFDQCFAASGDLSFEAGALLPPPKEGAPPTKHFDIESLEVWGVGGNKVINDALQERKKSRKIVSENIRKARKVDKAQFLDDFKSGLIESKAFAHQEQVSGRAGADCSIDDDNANNYTYEK